MDVEKVLNYKDECVEMKMILRGIAHEMGNALTVMGYSMKSISKEMSEKNSMNWDYLNEDYNYICRLFKNLSDYNNSKDLRIDSMCVDKLLSRVVGVVHDEYCEDGVEIKYTGYENAVILGDEIKLKQVFINIIKNAYEAVKGNNKEKGFIDIHISEKEGMYQIYVKDNGCGIKSEDIDRVFEPMYTKNKEGGTGLGLPVCKNIIESHGGNINVFSKMGVGTEFIIELKKEPLAL